MTPASCAAARSGFSFFKADASPGTLAWARGSTRRGEGHSASNPPARQARIHLSRLVPDTCTGRPDGPACAFAAMPRTSRPRRAPVSPGPAAAAISRQQNNATSRARAQIAAC
jgi:hypothetical protein